MLKLHRSCLQLIFLFFAFWQGENKLRAQVFEEGKNLISAGYGFPNLQRSVLRLLSDEQNFQTTGFGPAHLRYEFCLAKGWGVGASVNVTGYGGSWLDSGYSASLNVISYSGLFRINYYFVNDEKVQVYGGLGTGYRARLSTYQNNRPGAVFSSEIETLLSEVSLPVGFEATLGVRRRFSKDFGGYVECGLAKSVIQAGLFLSF